MFSTYIVRLEVAHDARQESRLPYIVLETRRLLLHDSKSRSFSNHEEITPWGLGLPNPGKGPPEGPSTKPASAVSGPRLRWICLYKAFLTLDPKLNPKS